MTTFMNTTGTRPPNPTATVFINGLALLCFSVKNDRAEVGFLKVREHPLLLTIYDSNCNPVFGTPFEIKSGAISVNSGGRGIGTVYQPGISEAEDFRYLLDFDRIHKVFDDERLSINPKAEYLAKLYVKNGMFFNAALSSQDGVIFYKDSRGDMVQALPSQRVGKVIGAYIDDDEVTIDITDKEPITLRKAESRYSVVIRYKCVNNNPHIQTDFDKFYKVLELPSEKHKITDLQYAETEIPYQHPCERNLSYQCKHNEKFREMAAKNEAMQKLLDGIVILAEEACQGGDLAGYPRNLEGEPE